MSTTKPQDAGPPAAAVMLAGAASTAAAAATLPAPASEHKTAEGNGNEPAARPSKRTRGTQAFEEAKHSFAFECDESVYKYWTCKKLKAELVKEGLPSDESKPKMFKSLYDQKGLSYLNDLAN